MNDSYYDVAQVCPNGHVATDTANRYPEHRRPFCEKCGEQTIMACGNCDAPIRGHYHVSGAIIVAIYEPPAFCPQCGSAFPWTERRQQAAIDLFCEETQDEDERRDFRESVEQITKDTPQAQVAAKRIGRLLGQIGKGTAGAIREIVIDVASETAKKLLLSG